jgi:nitrate/nitrite-specific signal transduction histidine kinase
MDVTNFTAQKSIAEKLKWDRAVVLARPVFKPRLSLKLLLLVAGVSLISMLAFTLVLLSFQQSYMIDHGRSTMSALSSTIETSLQHAMVTQEWTMAYDALEAVAREEVADVVRIMDSRGVIGLSSRPDEIGRRFDPAEPACRFCHGQSTPPANESAVFTLAGGSRVLLSMHPIQNQAECQACHSSTNQTLGLLMIEMPLTGVYSQLAGSLWQMGLLVLGTFVLLVGLLIPTIRHYVIRPVQELGIGVAQISAGNMDYEVQGSGQDELGQLAESFDAMRRQLKASYAEREQREQELSILNEVALAANQRLNLQEILDFALDTVVNKLGMAVGMIYLLDATTGRHTRRASRGASTAQLEEIDRRRRSGCDLTREVIESGKEIFVQDMADDPRFRGVWEPLEGRSYVKIPLMSKGRMVGAMSLVAPVGQRIDARTVDLLKAVGWEIGIAIDNATLLGDTRRREQQAVTLYQLGTRISASLALDAVLDAVAQAARDLLATDVGLVGLLEEGRQEIVIKGGSGRRANVLKDMRIPVCQMAPGSALLSGHPIISGACGPAQPALHEGTLIADERFVSFLAVPLRRGERFLGVIEVLARRRRHFLPRDAQLLMRLAHHVVVAIENAQLYRQLHHLATLEERDRLARELHDHLAQTLGYLNVKASITTKLLADGHLDLTYNSLQELKRITQVVYADVRESIFNLRTSVSSRAGLLATLEDYLAEYRARYGVDARLEVDADESIEFSPDEATQLLRIIQEALTNVRKHAQARRAWVRCRPQNGQVCVSIEDDGRGFDPGDLAGSGRQSFGLQIMRERAQSIGGTMEFHSLPGQGTRIVVRLNLGDEQGEAG